MTRRTAVLFCPGRGTYGRDELGFVGRTTRPGATADALAACDEERRTRGRPTLTEIDGAEKFRPSLHLDGENAAELIYFGTMAHVEQLRERYDIIAVAGNSLGWYTALPDDLWSYDWNNKEMDQVAVGVRMGRVFAIGKQQVNLFGQAWTNPAGSDRGTTAKYAFKVNLSFLFPKN